MGARVIRPGGVIAVFAAAVLTAAVAVSAARAQTAVKLTLDGRIEGPATPFLLALDQGYFKAEELDVTIDPAGNPAEPIARVATGGYDIGVADINALIRWRDQNTSVPLKAVYIVQNRPAYAIVTRKSRGVNEPKDLEGKKLGAPAADPASAQWPVFAKINGIDAGKVTVLNVGIPVREPMLAAGEVDAITGPSYGPSINLRQKNVPAEDIVVVLMADHGLELYGSAIIVNPKFAADKPEAVKAFLRAFTKAVKETSSDPVNAVLSVIQRNGAGSRDIELERLLIALKVHMLTAEVKANGLGEIDAARFERAIEQLALVQTFKTKPKAADIFDESFLPPEEDRKVQ
jgi:NitT/TauT family transport system substrate-binding protein